ncbi:hypothetical protein BHM03_00005705 [Ensete ventricosum]|nr:hypothetical protein BHM03_00005705 [Ensete ventricosum]
MATRERRKKVRDSTVVHPIMRLLLLVVEARTHGKPSRGPQALRSSHGDAMFNPRFVSYASQACEFSLRTWKAETEISAAGKGPIQIMRAVREWIGRLRGNLATSGLRADASGAQRGRTDGTARCVPFHFISQSLRDTSNRWGSVPTVSSPGLSDW